MDPETVAAIPDGVDVIDEEEFAWLTQLKAAKQRYRDAFSRLKESRSECDHATQVMEQCRHQLVQDFEAAFPRGSFASSGGPAPTPAAHVSPTAVDEVLDQDEEFEAMATERILQRDPDSLAFLKARPCPFPTRRLTIAPVHQDA